VWATYSPLWLLINIANGLFLEIPQIYKGFRELKFNRYEFRAILCKMLDGSYQVHIFQFYICTYALKITYQEKRKKIIMYCIPKVHFY